MEGEIAKVTGHLLQVCDIQMHDMARLHGVDKKPTLPALDGIDPSTLCTDLAARQPFEKGITEKNDLTESSTTTTGTKLYRSLKKNLNQINTEYTVNQGTIGSLFCHYRPLRVIK